LFINRQTIGLRVAQLVEVAAQLVAQVEVAAQLLDRAGLGADPRRGPRTLAHGPGASDTFSVAA
jgi:hypothetical protein